MRTIINLCNQVKLQRRKASFIKPFFSSTLTAAGNKLVCFVYSAQRHSILSDAMLSVFMLIVIVLSIVSQFCLCQIFTD